MFKYKDNFQKKEIERSSEKLILANPVAEIQFDVPTVFTHQLNEGVNGVNRLATKG